jgi:mannose-6-phosphate isomerase-like protein (cupin superfamily)
MNEIKAEQTSSPDGGSLRYLVDSYADWAKQEGPPVYEEFGVDLERIDTGRWPRLGDGCEGAIVNLKGRGEHMTVFVFDLPAAARSAPQRHIYDEVFFVLSGHGNTVVTLADGEQRSFEWGPNSLFSPPLNSHYQLFNGSGRERARVVSVNDIVFLMNFFRSEEFIFDNQIAFRDREGPAGFFSGEGEQTNIRPGRNLWETNFVADVSKFKLMEWEERGAGSSNIQFLLTEGSIGVHSSEMPVGTYKKAHRHGPGAHVLAVNGTGYSLLWYEGQKDAVRLEWKRGFVYAPPADMFHQHFNTGSSPARYVAYLFGSKRYPIISERRANSATQRTDVSLKEGGRQIDYADQDPNIHATWIEAIKTAGVQSRMGKYIDETKSGAS